MRLISDQLVVMRLSKMLDYLQKRSRFRLEQD